MNKQKIGVFDSGIGGLTVLDSLIEIFPNEDFLYVGDQGHCPYGIKPEEEIKVCVRRIGRYLIDQNVKAIVIACNTASLFIDEIRKMTSIPVISVIEPTCLEAIKLSKKKQIGVIATQATINKGKYQDIITQHGYEPIGIACSEFVNFVENCELDDPIGDELVEKKLKPFKATSIDTLIYGCTHFSIMERQIKAYLGSLNYVACGMPTSLYLKTILEEKELLNEQTKLGKVEIYTTGEVDKALNNMKWFKKEHLPITKLTLED